MGDADVNKLKNQGFSREDSCILPVALILFRCRLHD